MRKIVLTSISNSLTRYLLRAIIHEGRGAPIFFFYNAYTANECIRNRISNPHTLVYDFNYSTTGRLREAYWLDDRRQLSGFSPMTFHNCTIILTCHDLFTGGGGYYVRKYRKVCRVLKRLKINFYSWCAIRRSYCKYKNVIGVNLFCCGSVRPRHSVFFVFIHSQTYSTRYIYVCIKVCRGRTMEKRKFKKIYFTLGLW